MFTNTDKRKEAQEAYLLLRRRVAPEKLSPGRPGQSRAERQGRQQSAFAFTEWKLCSYAAIHTINSTPQYIHPGAGVRKSTTNISTLVLLRGCRCLPPLRATDGRPPASQGLLLANLFSNWFQACNIRQEDGYILPSFFHREGTKLGQSATIYQPQLCAISASRRCRSVSTARLQWYYLFTGRGAQGNPRLLRLSVSIEGK